jgi:hypothetical protein
MPKIAGLTLRIFPQWGQVIFIACSGIGTSIIIVQRIGINSNPVKKLTGPVSSWHLALVCSIPGKKSEPNG